MRRAMQSRSGFLAAALVACIACAQTAPAAPANSLSPDASLHVVTDPRTGLALFGVDAVAYHVDQAAVPGSPEHEVSLDGRLWRFRSAANKAAFEKDPPAYIPAFGGHDGESVSEGIMVKGDPMHFVIAAGELVLFRDGESRDRFAADAAMRQKARQSWPAVVRQHAGH
jgi:hypothetical protein